MKIDFIPKFVMLLAGAIICIITIVNDMDTTYSLEGNMFVKRNAGGINMELPEGQEEKMQESPAEEGEAAGEES